MLTCPACGKESPEGFQFCGFCATPFSAPAAAPVAKERKVVSVLFCDLVGFTSASEDADPEEVAARVAPYHARTRERIEAFGGTVEKFIGDAVMAVFGAPVAHEDDPERAVRAGLAILEAIEELNAADGSLALSVRVGVNTGEAVVALDARPEFFGQGRCLTHTGDPQADMPLRQARPLRADGRTTPHQRVRQPDRQGQQTQLLDTPAPVGSNPTPAVGNKPDP